MPTRCRLVLAIELAEPAPQAAATLPVEQAAGLVDAVATDLARLLPEVDRAGLVLAAALYDAAELLRPGWPLYAALIEHYRREPTTRAAPQLVALGSSAGRMAGAVLQPDPALAGGALRVLPLALVADGELAVALDARLESELEAQGLAGAQTAWYVTRAFGVQVAHARYLSAGDLCAHTAIQLEHAGLGAVWPLLEAALLAPQQDESVELEPGITWRYAGQRVHAPVLGYRGWLAAAGSDLAVGDRAAAWLAWSLRERQAGAVLDAHRLAVAWHACAPGVLDGAALIETDGGHGPAVALYLHQAPQLGLVAATALDAEGRAIAHAYPRWGATREDLLLALERTLGARPALLRSGPFTLHADGTAPAVPAP